MSLTDKRNYGIDLLRILSMLMVLLLHILGAGGVLGASERLSLNYEIAWFLETAAYCAVNCYALISGYVGFRAKHRYANLLTLWLQVVLYSAGITLIFVLISPENARVDTVLGSFFPVINNYGWYFTCYFALFFFMPLLNHVINTMAEKDLKLLCASAVGILSVLPTVATKDIFQINDGYSVLWLSALYLLGGCIGRFGWFAKTKEWILGLIYGGCVLCSWGAKYLLEVWNNPFLNRFTYSEVLIRYKSPTVLIAAVCLLLLFAQTKVPKFGRLCINFLAPTAFGVYIIQMHPQVWNRIIVGKFAEFSHAPAGIMVLKLLLTTVILYLGFSLTDMLRHYFFRWLKVKERLTKGELYIRERKKDKS